jgi:probable phosphoglycerate mutase
LCVVKFTGQDSRNLWLVRHGESTWNVQGLVQGHADDATLTTLGLRQADELASRFRGERFGAIYSSDLYRARQTADTISSALGLPVVFDAQLRERSFGEMEGHPSSSLAPEVTGISGQTVVDAAARPVGGESLNEVWERTRRWVDMLAAEPHEGDVLAVAHGGSIRTIRALCAGLTASDMPWDVVPNGSVWIVHLPTPSPDANPDHTHHAYEGVR